MKKIFIVILVFLFAMNNVSLASAQGEANTISLDIKGMDILDVLKILSMRSDLNIIAGKNVRGNVTMFLKDVDVWDAFEIILAANDLAYEKRGNIINVMTQRDYELLYGEKYQDRREVKTIKLKYARVEDVSAALSQIKTNIGKVVADDASKSIVLMDVAYKIKEMEEVIQSLDTPIVNKVYELQYANVTNIKDKITEMLTKNIGSMQIDERTNKIAITDTEAKIAELDEVIGAFDEKHKVVEIEAMILELTLNDQHRMGVDWNVAFQNLSSGLSKKLGDHVFSFDFSQNLDSGMTYGPVGDASKGLQATIELLQEYGRTRVLSNPRITVLNNEEAKILIGTNQPYVTSTASQSGDTTQTAYNVTYLDLGVKLIVTPTINRDGFITMKVKPEISSTSGTPLTYGEYSDEIPIVSTSTTETTVMIKDNYTIMLSGLIQNREEESIEKVPVLGDIPILGNLFKKTTRGNASEPERKEIIIFLTPRIVHGEGEDAVGAIRAERQQKKEQKQFTQETVSKHQLLEGKKEEENSIIWSEYMPPSNYYELIWQKVNDKVINNKLARPVHGEVIVSFMLAPDGKLAKDPQINALVETEPALMRIARSSIEEAAPFPPFPSTLKKQSETFNITISYE